MDIVSHLRSLVLRFKQAADRVQDPSYVPSHDDLSDLQNQMTVIECGLSEFKRKQETARLQLSDEEKILVGEMDSFANKVDR